MPDIVSDEPQNAYGLFKTGCRFLDQRHPGQAVMYLERALRLAPEKTSIREALGRAYFALGQYGSAADAFFEVARRAPANDYAHYALGRALLEKGDVRGAQSVLRLAVAMAPANEEYRQALARCLAGQGDPKIGEVDVGGLDASGGGD